MVGLEGLEDESKPSETLGDYAEDETLNAPLFRGVMLERSLNFFTSKLYGRESKFRDIYRGTFQRKEYQCGLEPRTAVAVRRCRSRLESCHYK